VFEGWAKGFVFKNAWRVSNTMDRKEALQECAFCFAKCLKYTTGYGGEVDNPKWFMSLFQRSVVNHFNTLATRDKRAFSESGSPLSRSEEFPEITHGWSESDDPAGVAYEYGDGPLLAAISGASAELKQVLMVIASAPTELLALLLREDSDETAWSRRMCRLCRVPNVNTNVIGELKNLLRAN